MADIKISQLGAAATLTGTEAFPESNSGVTYKVTAQQIKDFSIGTTPITGIGDGTATGSIKSLSDSAKDKILYFTDVACAATTGNFASLSNSAITQDHIVVDIVWNNQNAIATDITWTTSNGSLVINGTCVDATTASITLVKKDN